MSDHTPKPIAASELLSIDDLMRMTGLPKPEIVEAMRQGRLGFDIIDRQFVVSALDLFDWLARHDRAAYAFRDPALKPYGLITTADGIGWPREPQEAKR